MDPDCPECGSVMTDVPNAAASFNNRVASRVARKANDDPRNTPGA